MSNPSQAWQNLVPPKLESCLNIAYANMRLACERRLERRLLFACIDPLVMMPLMN